MDGGWEPDAPGVLTLPSGRRVRGRALRRPLPSGRALRRPLPSGPRPDLGLYLLGHAPEPTPWPHRWLRWPDFRLPADRAAARQTFVEVLDEAAHRRVEIGCGGGRGRTGTALACLAVLDGVPGSEAVAHVRQHYDRRAVETPWQRRYVERFSPPPVR